MDNHYFPEIYRRLAPYIERITDDQWLNASSDICSFENLVASVIIKSGILRNPPECHNTCTIKDTTRIILAYRLQITEN